VAGRRALAGVARRRSVARAVREREEVLAPCASVLGGGGHGGVGAEVPRASAPTGRFRRARGKGTPTMSPAQRMSEGHCRQPLPPPPRGRRQRLKYCFSWVRSESGLTAQARLPPHGHETRSPRRVPLPSAPGGTSRCPQRPSAPRRGRRAPGSPRRPSPRMRPLRGPRCRKRRRFTSWHFLQSSRLLDVAAMLRRTGVIDGDALRGFSAHMSGMRCRGRHPANHDVRRPGALRRTRFGWWPDRSPWKEHRAHAPRLMRDDPGRRRPRRIRKAKN
jgi:hypothetical protein